jgi:mannose-1-phosphate guanylyltransferase
MYQMANRNLLMTQEEIRLAESSARKKHWKRWGPYLSERAWGTVREDYSPDGKAWEYFFNENAIELNHSGLGQRWLHCDGAPELLFTENETNTQRLFNTPNRSPYVKDGINDYIVNGNRQAVNPAQVGTKAAANYSLTIQPGGTAIIRLRLTNKPPSKGGLPPEGAFGKNFDYVFAKSIREANEFYETVIPNALSDDAPSVMRQACAGLLWSKQFYHYVVEQWLDGDPATPKPPTERVKGRNHEWKHLYNADLISMPDKWKYPCDNGAGVGASHQTGWAGLVAKLLQQSGEGPSPASYSSAQVHARDRFANFCASADACERWAVILAGGDGTRLRSMTRAIARDDRPKQFCPIVGGRTLLDQTRDRVALSVAAEKTLLMVTEKHLRWFQPLADTLPKYLLVVQPENKGTAPAILYGLLRIAAKSPGAIVAVFPSDHFTANDEAFMAHIDSAYDAVRAEPDTVVLLGITPEAPEVEYGWIEPQTSILGSLPRSITRVRRFWEKPSPSVARALMERGCLWSSFVMVGFYESLLKLTERALPELYDSFAKALPMFDTATDRSLMRELYRRIPETSFSHEVLATRPDDLAVMRVGDVGWSDLGEPARVLSLLARMGVQTQFAKPPS